MDRTSALTWLQNRYGNLYTKAGVPLTDTGDGFGQVLDSAWAMLGVATTEAIVPSRQVEIEAALEFHALQKAAITYVTRYSKSVGGITLQTFQQYQGIKQLLDAASRRLISVGLASPDTVALFAGSYNEIELKPKRTAVVPRSSSTGLSTEWG